MQPRGKQRTIGKGGNLDAIHEDVRAGARGRSLDLRIPGENWRIIDTTQKGWRNSDQGSQPLATNMGTAGATPFGPGENWRPNDTKQKGWANVDK